MTLPEDVHAGVRLLTRLPILACSIVGTALTVMKWLPLRRSRLAGERLIALVTGLERGSDNGAALAAARLDGSIAARLVEYGLALGTPSRAEHAGRQPTRRIERGLDAVALIATLGTLLGLFGTVVGIVLVFDRLSSTEVVVGPNQLAGGIGTALYTTVAGLILGMFALVSHRFLTSRADEAIARGQHGLVARPHHAGGFAR